jgi:hypothetical protein
VVPALRPGLLQLQPKLTLTPQFLAGRQSPQRSATMPARRAKLAGDIGQSLVSAFQSAENAVGNFVKTGKLDFRDLVTSLLADLAKLAARRFILGPIANALSGVFSAVRAGFSPAFCMQAGW